MSILFYDIEVDGDPWTGRLLCVAWSYDDHSSKVEVEPSPTLLELLADPEVTKVEHSKFDARWLRLNGREVSGPVIDTMTMAWQLDEAQPLDLESLALRYLGLTMDKRVSRNKNVIRFRRDDGKFVPIGEAPRDQLEAYCLRDVDATRDLFFDLYRWLLNESLYETWSAVDVPFTGVLLDMECVGMPVEIGATQTLLDRLSAERDRFRAELTEKAGLPSSFNLNSGDQVAAYLFLDEFELPGRVPLVGEGGVYFEDAIPDGFTVTKAGRKWLTGIWQVQGKGLMPRKDSWTKSNSRPRVDNATLAVHYASDPWVALYLEYSKLDKLIGTYLGPFIDWAHAGRLYAKWNQTATVTGRISSSEPNLMNIPARGEWGQAIRDLFRGDFIIADYSQLEPRLAAHFSQDPGLLRVFDEGLDVYRVLGQSVFDRDYDDVTMQQRDTCKELMLAMQYGAMARKISERISLRGFHTTVSVAQGYLDALQEAYPVFWDWKDGVVLDAEETGYVETISGRRRHLAEQMGSAEWKVRTHGERQAVNSVIQGSAADVVRATMLEAVRVFPDLPLLIQVHDEVEWWWREDAGYDLDDVLRELQRIGENPPWELSVPLVFEPKRVRSWKDK